MPALETQIDDLYRQPLDAFIAARTALAKTLTGADAQRVRRLVKPLVVPWAINQVYWEARPVFDAVMRTGAQVRTVQVAALEGRKADVRAASEVHRHAVADAVTEAVRLANAAGVKPSPEVLMRTFEALSLTPTPIEPPGRLTRPLQPSSGFEALGGLKLQAPPVPSAATTAAARRAAKKEADARRKAEAAQKKHDAEIKRAEAALQRAREKMAKAEALLRETRKRES